MNAHPLAVASFGLSLAFVAAPPGVAQAPLQSGPLGLVANQGQYPPEVRFRLRRPGLAVQLLPEALLLTLVAADDAAAASSASPPRERLRRPLRPARRHAATVRMEFLGAAAVPAVVGERPLPGRLDAHRGAVRIADVPTFAGARYRDVYPGIDLVLETRGAALKSEWHVRPGADPAVIRWRYVGASATGLDGAGLAVDTALGRLRELPPVAATADGAPVAVAYALDAAGVVGFALGPRDPAQALVIDPVLAWSTLLGGNDTDELVDVATDAAGNVYVCGTTTSDDLPVAPGLQQLVEDEDAYVAKFDPTGSTLLRATYFGGGGHDAGNAIALDPVSGDVYLTGTLGYSGWSMPPGRAQAFGGTLVGGSCQGSRDGFLARFDPQLQLVYATYVGGSYYDTGEDVAVDANGDVYVSVHTDSWDFPVSSNAFQTAPRGSMDVAVTKIAANGMSRLWGTFLGGSGYEAETRLAVDAAGTVHLVGSTESANFPTVANPGSGLAQALQGGADAFVARLNATGTALLHASYLGGSGDEEALALAVDAAGNLYVAGSTESASWVPALRGSLRGGLDGFVVKIDAAGNLASAFAASYFGGSALDVATGIALAGGSGGAREVYVVGATTSVDRFASPVPFLTSAAHRGSIDVFLAKANVAGDLTEFTWFGGGGEDIAYAVAAASRGAVIAGYTASPDLPTTPGAYDRGYSFWGEGFVARFADGSAEIVGVGTFGSGPCVPALSAWGHTVPGGTFQLEMQNAVGGSLGFLLMGFTGGAMPLGCGTVYLAPPAVTVTLPLGGSGPCGGSASLPFPLPANAALSGLDLFLQFAGLDSNGCWRTSPFTLSNGLRVRIG